MTCPICGAGLATADDVIEGRRRYDDTPDGHADRHTREHESKQRVVREFVDWVASNAAYNGADDEGQRFYDWDLNDWLPLQAIKFAADRTADAT